MAGSNFTLAMALNKALSGFMTALILAFVYQLFYFKSIKKFFIFLTGALALITSVIQVVVKEMFDVDFDFTVMDLLAGTNPGEVQGFLDLYFNWKFIGLVLLAFMPFILAFVFRKQVRAFAVYLVRKPYYVLAVVVLWALTIQLNLGKVFGHRYEAPILVAWRYAKTYKKAKTYADSLLKEGTFRAKILKNESTIPNIVLVIGESASSDYMSIYGYKFDTTPAAKSWEAKGNLAVFRDVITARPSTSIILPMLISFTGYDAPELNDHTANNISDIFKQCGYKTFWISNQERDTNASSYTTFTADCLSDYSNYISGRFSAEKSKKFGNLDGVLLTDFLRTLETERLPNGKSFYVLHLQGSHYAYNLRYPENFERWTASDLADEPLKEDMKQRVAEYLNSLYYTDHLLGVMMENLNDEESILIYLSDHGQELGQNGKYRGHSHSMVISQSMFRIPFFIWMSDKFIENNPEKAAQIRKAAEESKPWMSDSLPHLLLDIADIETTQYKPEMSVINPAFVVKERKILGINYEDFEP